MLLDLDKWNPFRFLRHSSEEQPTQASSGATQQARQPPSQRTAATQPSGAAVSALWSDPPRWPLADPFHLLTDLIRDPFGGLGPLEQWFGDFSPSRFQPRIDVVDDGDALRIVAELPGLSRDDVKLEVIDASGTGHPFDDVLTFKNGVFTSQSLAKKGFKPVQFDEDMRKFGPATFTANQRSDSGDTAKWTGTVAATSITGDLVWTKKDGTVLNYSYSGERSDQ